MGNILNFIQEIFLLKKDDEIKVGLTQFKKLPVEPIRKETSVKTKEVKISDLMRRVS